WCRRRIRFRPPPRYTANLLFQGGGGPTGARVLLADGAGTAKLWDPTTGRGSCCETHSLSPRPSYISGSRISADQSADRCRRSPPWVKLRNTRTEHRSSAIPPITDVGPDVPPGSGRANNRL